MYIFVSIVYFIVVPKKLEHEQEKHQQHETVKNVKVAASDITKDLKEEGFDEDSFVGKTADFFQKKVNAQEFKTLSFKQQEEQIKQLKATIDTSKTDREEYEDLLEKYQRYHIIKQDSTYEAYLSRQQKLPENDRDSWFDRILKKREIAINQKSASGNWSVKEELEHYRPKQYFLLMPLLALFIMWNFRKNHIYYLDHLIFTIHGTTAFFIVQIFTVPLRRLLGSGAISSMIQFLVVIGIAWYLFKALTVFYQRPKKVIIKKMITLFILYFIAFGISEWIIERSIYYFIA